MPRAVTAEFEHVELAVDAAIDTCTGGPLKILHILDVPTGQRVSLRLEPDQAAVIARALTAAPPVVG